MTRTETPAKSTTWITTEAVRLRCAAVVDGERRALHPVTLRALMAITRAEDEGRVWVNKRTATSPVFLWDESLVDEWFRRATWLRANSSPTVDGKSGGVTPTAPRTVSDSTSGKKQKSTASSSRTSGASARPGSPSKLARSLISETP